MTDPATLDPAFARRRQAVLDALGADAAMVLAAAPEVVVGRDLELRYMADPDLWYLTGYAHPEAVAVLCPSAEAPFTLFVRPRDPKQELWTGPRGGPAEALERYGADRAHPVDELASRLAGLLADAERVYFRLGGSRDVERVVLDTLTAGRSRRQRSGRGPAQLIDPGLILDEMRLVKEPAEVDAIREAVAITVDGFREGLRAVRPGAGEWEVEAALEAAMRRRGADGPAFATIAASADNATVLHYVANDRRMDAGDLLLLDAGARRRMYNGDLTRTVPVDGRLTAAQADVHGAVLAARDAAIRAIQPGATTRDVHAAAVRVLVGAMVDLDLLDGDPEAHADQTGPDAPWKRWFPHNTSHWLGLDVHDVGTYSVHGQPRALQPGMVLTVEPGLYIPAHADDAPRHLRGIGVRIEDDILVTDTGADVLSHDLPTDPDALRSLLP